MEQWKVIDIYTWERWWIKYVNDINKYNTLLLGYHTCIQSGSIWESSWVPVSKAVKFTHRFHIEEY